MSRTKSWLCAICFLVTPALFALPSAPPARADALYNNNYYCACCASAGEWFLTQEAVGEDKLREFGRLGLDGNANRR